MENTFPERQKLLLWGCNFFGFTYIPIIKTESTFLRHAELCISAPTVSLYFLCIYLYGVLLASENVYQQYLNSQIGDPLALIICALTYITKWLYYLLRRNKTKQIVLEVFSLQKFD